MNTEKEALSYGQYLKSMRLAKGISLDEISRETRIGKDLLLSIEREDDEALPAEVFVKGFLRAYAGAVGIDGAEVIRKYASQHQTIPGKVADQKVFNQPRRRIWPLLLSILGGLGLLVLFSIYLTRETLPPGPVETPRAPSVPKPAVKAPAPPEAPEESAAPAAPLTSEAPPASTQNVPLPEPEEKQAVATPEAAATKQAGEAQKLTLSVVTREETWMKIIVDGGKPKEYTLNPGDRLALEGRVAFNLLIGNAGGVELRFNGRPVDIPGKRGQVVTLQLP